MGRDDMNRDKNMGHMSRDNMISLTHNIIFEFSNLFVFNLKKIKSVPGAGIRDPGSGTPGRCERCERTQQSFLYLISTHNIKNNIFLIK